MASIGTQFLEIDKQLRLFPDRIVVKPPNPKNAKGGKILTGLLKWVNERGTEQDFRMTGPPCEAYGLVGKDTGTVKYAKCTILLIREGELQDIDMLGMYAKERADFLLFIRYIEKKVKDMVTSNTSSFFLRDIDASKVELVSAIKTPPDEDKPLRMPCKIDVSDQVGPNKENIDPEHILLKITDSTTKSEYKVSDMRRDDIYLPVFSSAYPYFNSRGDFGIQFKLSSLVVLHRGAPPAGDNCQDGLAEILLRYNVAPSSTKRELENDDDDTKMPFLTEPAASTEPTAVTEPATVTAEPATKKTKTTSTAIKNPVLA
jgi:hypothetical protein